jgi:hypothetical protein
LNLKTTKLYLQKTYSGIWPVGDECRNKVDSLDIGVLIQIRLPKGKEEQRSIAQNRLYWAWMTDLERTQVNEFAGYLKDWWHKEMKRRYLVSIFERDSDEYSEMIGSLRAVYLSGLKKEAKNLMDYVIESTSITDCNTLQFMEYLKSIENFAHEKCIQLRTDYDYYQAAMEK